MSYVRRNRIQRLSTVLLLMALIASASQAQFWKPFEKSKISKPLITKVRGVENIDENEPNNTIGTANTLPLDSVMDAMINPAGDVDYFKVNVSAFQTIAFDIDAEVFGSYMNSYLELFDSSGTLLAENDDYGYWLDSKIIYTFAQAGNYYAKVTELDGSGGTDYYYSLKTSLFQTQGNLNLTLVNSWKAPNAAYLIRKNNNYLYSAETDSFTSFSVFKIWNISDIHNPALLDTFLTTGMISDLLIDSDHAYLAMADNEMGLRILNISNPAVIQEDTMIEGSESNGLYLLNDTLFVADGGGFSVFDLSNPVEPVFLWDYHVEDDDGIQVVADSQYVYVTMVEGQVRIVNRNTHLMVGDYDVFECNFMNLRKPYLYVSSSMGSLSVLDVSNPSNPNEVGGFYSDQYVSNLSLVQDNGYLSNGSNGLQILNCSDPSNVTIKGYHFSMSDFFAFNNVADNDLIYVASGYIEGYYTTADANRIMIFKNELLGVSDKQPNEKPTAFELYQNYPNPFNPSTTMRYNLPKAGQVSLKIYNTLGQEIRTLVNGVRPAGTNEIIWDGKNNSGNSVSSGIYLYRLKAGNFTLTKKMTLMK